MGKKKKKRNSQTRHESPKSASPKRRRSESIPNSSFPSRNNNAKDEESCSNHPVTKKKVKAANEKHNKEKSTQIAPLAIQWLERRKKKVPESSLQLLNQNNKLILLSSLEEEINQILELLPSLRERERRALTRYIEKEVKKFDSSSNGETHSNDKALENLAEGSDGEYEVDEKNGNDTNQLPEIRNGGTWPSHVEFSNNYRWDQEHIPNDIQQKYAPQNRRHRAARPSQNVYIQKITDPTHPACGEFGLYCARPHLPPGSWLLDYVGHVTLGDDQDRSSDYVSDFGEQSELACDANVYGNEARFVNDFRNTGKHANVEFNVRRDERGELRQGVYVKLQKDMRGKTTNNETAFDGVWQDEELLVSYGKSYWRSRVGNLTDFVWRLPGQPFVAKEQRPINDGTPSSAHMG